MLSLNISGPTKYPVDVQKKLLDYILNDKILSAKIKHIDTLKYLADSLLNTSGLKKIMASIPRCNKEIRDWFADSENEDEIRKSFQRNNSKNESLFEKAKQYAIGLFNKSFETKPTQSSIPPTVFSRKGTFE